MARETLKRLVIHFYDDDQGAICLEWLAEQDNMGDSIRDLIVKYVTGALADGDLPDTGELESLRRRVERLEDMLLAANIQTGYQMARPVQMTAPTNGFGTKIEPPTDGRSDGTAANNLLKSINGF